VAEITHKDRLGRELRLGDFVAYPIANSLVIGKINKVNPKMLDVSAIGKKKFFPNRCRKYPEDCVRLDGTEVTMFLLKGE
jgi:hypothetical protein